MPQRPPPRRASAATAVGYHLVTITCINGCNVYDALFDAVRELLTKYGVI